MCSCLNYSMYYWVFPSWLFMKIDKIETHTILMNAPSQSPEAHGLMIVNLGTHPRLLTEREKSLALTELYRRFIVFLFFKIKECLGSNLIDPSNIKTLALSSLEWDDIVFRCWATLKITLPKTLDINGFTLSQLDHLSDEWAIVVNEMEIEKAVWASHQVNLYVVRDTQWLSENVREEVKSIIAIEKSKDRSLRWKRGRMYNKLMGISSPENQENETIPNVQSQPAKPRITTVTIKWRIS